jgi:hypothetical protein
MKLDRGREENPERRGEKQARARQCDVKDTLGDQDHANRHVSTHLADIRLAPRRPDLSVTPIPSQLAPQPRLRTS